MTQKFNKLISIELMFFIFFGLISSTFAQSPYPVRVLKYLPAPGQFINERYPHYDVNDTQEIMNAKALQCLQTPDSIISLGVFGGYIILAFDHSIVNSFGNYDFKVYGNAFSKNSEPGIVMVSQDVNGNGLADDVWYELKGSEYEQCTKNYEITYTRPYPLNSDIQWTDNQGNSGLIKRNSFHKQASYFPLWIEQETLTFSGTLFPESLIGNPNQWGYADNVQNNSDLCKFKIDWAIDENGNSVVLSSIDFIKIYTAVNKDGGVIGEYSTELAYPGIEDLHVSTGIEAKSTSTWNAYPNPFSEIIFLEKLSGNETIQVFSTLDQIIIQQSGNQSEINTSNWKSGIYFIKIFNKTQQQVFKMVKK